MTSSIKVGILSQWYAPEPVLIPKTIADAILASGNSVRVLTGFPNYPGGAVYPGFEGVRTREEQLDGASLLRVRSFTSHDQNAIRRIGSFLSFAWSSIKRSSFLNNCDVIYVYGTPMTAAAAAVALRIRRKIPFIIHVQDLWPESVLDSGMIESSFLRRVLQAVISATLKPVYQMAHHIVVISPGMKDALIERGVDASKISTLLNWHADEQDSSLAPKREVNSQRTIRCVYAGNIGQMQDVETIIRAAEEIQDELDLEIVIYGSGVAEESARKLADELKVRNITFMGRVSMEEMRSVYRGSDFQLVTLKDREVFRITIPSKFQASMAYGTPVITTVNGDLATICEKEGVGLVAVPESPSSLAETFRRAAALGATGRADMARRSHQFYWSRMAADRATASIMNRLSRAVEDKGSLNSRDAEYEGKSD